MERVAWGFHKWSDVGMYDWHVVTTWMLLVCFGCFLMPAVLTDACCPHWRLLSSLTPAVLTDTCCAQQHHQRGAASLRWQVLGALLTLRRPSGRVNEGTWVGIQSQHLGGSHILFACCFKLQCTYVLQVKSTQCWWIWHIPHEYKHALQVSVNCCRACYETSVISVQCIHTMIAHSMHISQSFL